MRCSITILLVFVVAVQLRNWDAIDYNEWCAVKENTPCVTHCKVGSNCGQSFFNFKDLTNRQNQINLDLHNTLRNEIARGDYIDWHFPPGTNLYVMNHHEECQFLAQCWLRQCNFWHDPHFTKAGKSMGQNLHERGQTVVKLQVDDTFMAYGTMAWFNEYKMLINYEGIYKKRIQVKGTGHFTAIIWHHTTGLGCAQEFGMRGEMYWYAFYCNMFPAGNVRNKAMYETEKFDCQRSKIFPHLCGEVIPLKDENGNDIVLPLPPSIAGAKKRTGHNKGCILLPNIAFIMYYILINFMLHLL